MMNDELTIALQENDRLRAMLNSDTITLAHADAMALALRHAAAHPTSRRHAANYRMSDRRWMRARALLMAARVFDKRRGWVIDDINLVSVALARAANSTSRISLNMRMARDGR